MGAGKAAFRLWQCRTALCAALAIFQRWLAGALAKPPPGLSIAAMAEAALAAPASSRSRPWQVIRLETTVPVCRRQYR